MNKSNNPEAAKKRGWRSSTAVRKGQIIGALVGALLTTLLSLPVVHAGGQGGFPSFLGMLYLLSLLPAARILETLGVPSGWFTNFHASDFRFAFICVAVAINATIGFVAGTVIGFITKPKTNPPS